MTGQAIASLPQPGAELYSHLISVRDTFRQSSEYIVRPPETGWGFRVQAGQIFRLRTVDEPQIADVCVMNAHNPSEHYAPGSQLAIEGSNVTRLTRIWGTPPESRPLCTCIADTLRQRDDTLNVRHHVVYSGHCNPHHWKLFAGIHPQTCYDNLRAGMASIGLDQRLIHDNLNIFQKSGIDPVTGNFLMEPSDAEAGDYIEFYAEIDLVVVMSLCPSGGGTRRPEEWARGEIPVNSLAVEIFETDTKPLAWPAAEGGTLGG